MGYRLRTALVVVTAILMSAVFEPLSAGQGAPPLAGPTARLSAVNAVNTDGPQKGLIVGQTLNFDRTPLAYARVRLRNLDSGAVVGRTGADRQGQFEFLVSARGNYVAELIDDTSHVLATGEALTAELGQTVATVVVLPARAPSFAGLFGNSTAAIVAAAAGAGITAVVATGQPLSPER